MRRWCSVAVLAAAALAATGCERSETERPASGLSAAEHVEVRTREDFRRVVLKADRPVLVDFYATWCPPCKVLSPILDRIAADYQPDVTLVKVDVDRADGLAGDHDIRSIPTVVLFVDGSAKRRWVGLQDESEYRQALDAIVR